MPWSFTQEQPLGTSEFIVEAKRRCADLRPQILRELCRRRVLIPFVYISNRQVRPVPAPAGPEPRRGGALLRKLPRRCRLAGA
jgi:hypothetical protein